MITIDTILQMRQAVADARGSGDRIALVPTMGALHAGHASLIDAARDNCDFLVVSIFVNPTQFAQGEDLASYPRPLEEDISLCKDHGADAVFVPSAESMYPFDNRFVQVVASGLTDSLCGLKRPGHFAGVCTVVAKLFNIVQPTAAYFGAKDFQQAVIISQMVRELDFPVEVVVCETVRQPDGLAISSRNRYLSTEQRKQAPVLFEALEKAKKIIRRNSPPADEVIEQMTEHISSNAPAGQIEYIQIVSPRTLEQMTQTRGDVLVALAVRFGSARLIDNIFISSQT